MNPVIENPMRRWQEIYRRESRSFLQYIAEAEPWARPDQRRWVEQVRVRAAEERRLLEAFSRHLLRLGCSLPPLGAYPIRFTGCNFLTIHALLPLLSKEQSRELDTLKLDIASLDETGSVPDQLRALLAGKQATLAVLNELQAGAKAA